MKTITINDLDRWRACYLDDDAEDWQRAIIDEWPAKGRDLLDILRDERIPAEDRVWVAARAMPIEIRRRWQGRLVRRALDRVDADPRSLAVLEYLDRGEEVPDGVRLSAYAAYAAAAAAYSYAYDYAYDYDYDSAACACAAAACAAAAYAAYASDCAARTASQPTAERQDQVTDALELLEEL